MGDGHSDPVFLGKVIIGAVAQVFEPSQGEVSEGGQDPALFSAGKQEGVFAEEPYGLFRGEGGDREALPVEGGGEGECRVGDEVGAGG